MPLPPAAVTHLPLSVEVAQSGAFAGIRNSVFTHWLPGGQGVVGLAGSVALTANGPGFSEALVQLGSTGDTQSACARRNGSQMAAIPANDRIWAGILKNTQAGTVAIPVDVRLIDPMLSQNARGTCLLTLVSAGYAFLSRTAALYTTTRATLTLDVAALPAGSAPVLALGIGGEFRFRLGGPPLANYVGLRAERRLQVDGIAVSLSAAPVTGAPAGAGWGAMPAGPWRIGTDFIAIPAAACAAARLQQAGAHPDFTILRQPTPGPFAAPAGSRVVLAAPLAGRATIPAQRAGYRAVHGLILEPGDCLLAVQASEPEPITDPASLDVENQSTIYLSR